VAGFSLLALAVLTITLTAQQAWAAPAEVSAQAVSGHDYLGGGALATDSGRGVAVGDLDADGIDDIAIGVPGSDHVCLVRGAIAMGAAPEDVSVLCKAGAVAPNAFRINAPTALTGSGGFGLGLEIADIDCDGQNDLIIGDPLADPVAGLAGGVKVDGGAIHVLHKSAGLVWGQEIFADNWRLYTGGNGYSIMSGGAQLEMFGYPAAGDIDNDGLVDLVVGAPIHRHGFARAGRVYLLGTAAVVEFNFCANGPINNPVSQPLSIMDGAPACGGSCSCVASACIDMKKDDAWFGQGLDVADVNTDGIDDLVVGSPSDGVAVESRVYIKYGPIGASPAVYPVDYPSPYTSADSCIGDGDAVFDRLGTDLAAADYDADGKLELYIGAPLYSGGGMAQNGGVFVLSGGTYSGLNTSINTAPAVWYGKVNDGNLGWGVDLGDLDGDGTLDLSVGGSGIGDPNGTTHVIKEPAPDPCLTLVCNDGNECTSDSCALGACVFTPVANDTVCTDDGLYCTGSESCQAGACTSGGDPCVGGAECDDSCNEAANSCAVAANTACTSDGNECTDDVCDGTGACAHPAVANDTACTDDGLYCTGAETCQAAACTSGGDPCVGGAECADSCDEAANSCDVSAGTACTNDGNECTDDQCDGAGACAHPALANGTACSDDGLYCTGAETCQAAACTSGGDPCVGGAECADSCDEAANSCDVSAGTACTNDGNECTDDQCDGAGACAHPALANGTACSDDGLYCTGIETCQAAACTSGGDPCTGLGVCFSCDEVADSCDDTDADGDLICGPDDNCAAEYNPDQLNSDCPPGGTDTGFGGIDCSAPLGANEAGCCDGGDVCDACPANNDNSKCDAGLSGGESIGAAGGSFSLGGCVSVTIPAGALAADTSISVSTGLNASTNPLIGGDPIKLKKAGGSSVHKYIILPHGQSFLVPITLGFCWDDADSDGTVDLGTCDLDASLTCDDNADCGAFAPCNGGGSMPENNLLLRREGKNFDYAGFGTSAPGSVQKCGDAEHQNVGTCGPAAAVADCTDAPGVDEASVANCCDTAGNSWPWQTCNFSEYYFGELSGDLIPGKGSEKTDCHLEWSVVNPFNTEDKYDRRGLLNYKQDCTDGDANCDKDGEANGVCTFEIGLCLNVDDRRLFDKKTLDPVCTPTATDLFQLKKPRPNSRKLHEAEAAEALLAAVMELDVQATIGGRRLNEVTFSGLGYDNGDACTNTFQLEVPLNGRSRAKGKVKASVETVASETLRATRDKDTLKFTCYSSE